MSTVNKFNATAATFMQQVVEASHTTPVLVDFWAAWCGPCKQLMPLLDRLADEYAGRFALAKVDTDAEQALAGQLGIRSLPTVVLFKDGQVVDHFVGAVPEAQIRQLLDRHLPAPPQSPLERARQLRAAGDVAGALLALDDGLARDQNNVELRAERGLLQLLSGNEPAAREMLQSLQKLEPTAAPVRKLAATLEFHSVIAAHPHPAQLREALAHNPEDFDARHALAVHRLLADDYDAALADWLELMRKHRRHKDDLARKSLIMALDTLDPNDPRVAQTRRAMAQLIF